MKYQFKVAILHFVKVLFILVFISPCIAQKKFNKGYIVLPSGDTLKGLVDNSKPRQNYSRLLFKSTKKSQPTQYRPFEVIGYGVENVNAFQAVKGQKGGSDFFAQLILGGHASLLHNGKIFLVKKDSDFLTLPKPYVKTVENRVGKFSQQIRSYQDSLYLTLGDCPDLNEKIKQSSYSYVSFYKLFKNYNQCVGSPIREFAKAPWIRVDYKLGIGLTETRMTMNLGYFPHLVKPAFDVSRKRSIGGGIELYSPRVIEQLRFSLEAWWISNLIHGQSRTVNSNTIDHYEFFVETTSVKIPFGLKYYLRTGSLKPYAGIGVNIERLNKGKYYGTREIESYGVVTTDDLSSYEFRKSMFGYWVSLGINLPIASPISSFIEIRLEDTNGYWGPTGTDLSHVSSLSALIGIKF